MGSPCSQPTAGHRRARFRNIALLIITLALNSCYNNGVGKVNVSGNIVRSVHRDFRLRYLPCKAHGRSGFYSHISY